MEVEWEVALEDFQAEVSEGWAECAMDFPQGTVPKCRPEREKTVSEPQKLGSGQITKSERVMWLTPLLSSVQTD